MVGKRFWPIGVLLAYFVLIVVLQPPGRWVPPMWSPPGYPLPSVMSRLVYDDADVVAWILRAENAARGRLAGLEQEPGSFQAQTFPVKLLEKKPLTERYFLEYPPAALAFFRLGNLFTHQGDVSSAILDANQFNLLFFDPQKRETRQPELPEFAGLPHLVIADPRTLQPVSDYPLLKPDQVEVHTRLFQDWRRTQQIYSFLLLAVLAGYMVLLERGVGRNGHASGPAWLCLLPAMLYFTPCRYDILPAVLTVAAIAATERRRIMLGAGLLGLAVAFKMYPLVLAPLLLRYAAQDRRTVIRWCLMFPLPFLAFATLMLATDGLPGLINPLKFQLSRPVEPWWVFYGRLIPEQFAADGGVAKVLRSGLVLVVVLAMAGKRPPSVQSLLRRCAIAVMLFVSMQVFYSPQWWQWIAVLVFPLVRTHRGLLPLVILADLLTYLGFPIFFDWHLSGALADSTAYPLRSAMVYLRALLWFGIVVVLVRQEFREQKPAPGESSVVR